MDPNAFLPSSSDDDDEDDAHRADREVPESWDVAELDEIVASSKKQRKKKNVEEATTKTKTTKTRLMMMMKKKKKKKTIGLLIRSRRQKSVQLFRSFLLSTLK